jgi:hypothetical protein
MDQWPSLRNLRAGGAGWGLTDPDWPDGPLDARKARLRKDPVLSLRLRRRLGARRQDRTPSRSWYLASAIRACWKPTDGALPKMLADRTAMPKPSKSSRIRGTSAMPSARNQWRRTLIQPSSTSKRSQMSSPPLPNAGLGNLPGAPNQLNPAALGGCLRKAQRTC